MIEKNLDIPFIANLALREKQIQQNYRPVIAVHKWFARRHGIFAGHGTRTQTSQRVCPPLRRGFWGSESGTGF
jgi:putative DNA methylase